jgi:hypothetical protein
MQFTLTTINLKTTSKPYKTRLSGILKLTFRHTKSNKKTCFVMLRPTKNTGKSAIPSRYIKEKFETSTIPSKYI